MVQGVLTVDGYVIDVNPATGEEIARIKCSTAEEVAAAVARARAAQTSWAVRSLERQVTTNISTVSIPWEDLLARLMVRRNTWTVSNG